MFDYQKSLYWKEYIASLENETDSGLGGFCEYLCDRLEAAQQLRAADLLEWCGCEGYTPTMENGKCSACGKNAHR